VAEATARLSKLARLSSWQWWVLLSAPLVLSLTALRLRFGGFRRTLARLRRPSPSTLPAPEQLAVARDAAFALAVAVKYGPWRPRCLLRSLALGWYLGRLGIAFEIRLGLPAGTTAAPIPANPDFTAHAWVEHAGEVLNDRPDVAQTHRAFDAGVGPL
jgi:hypothetical protein